MTKKTKAKAKAQPKVRNAKTTNTVEAEVELDVSEDMLDPADRNIGWWQDAVHRLARAKGWYPNGERNVPEALALIHSEISEALEEYRLPGDLPPLHYTSDGKPVGLGIELADAVIRIMDLCEYLEIDLEACMCVKHSYNRTRPARHGGKKA